MYVIVTPTWTKDRLATQLAHDWAVLVTLRPKYSPLFCVQQDDRIMATMGKIGLIPKVNNGPYGFSAASY